MKSCFHAICAFLLLLPLGGCGGSQEAHVTGVVTLDGAPLAAANVVFNPVESGPIAYASTDADGNYEVKTGQQTGLPTGKYQVTVMATKMPEMEPNSLEEPVPILTTPEVYSSAKTTPFEVEVASGSNHFPLEMVSQ